MHRLVPAFILEQYAKGEKAGSFDACTIFVDISGFTAITDVVMGHGQHGAEVLGNIIQDVFDPLIQSVFAHNGFVTNLAGDAFTALFPADNQSPDACRHALAAAWQMQQLMATASQYQTPYGNFDLSVKVGLAAGEAAWGIITSASGDRATFYFQGPAIDGCVGAQKLARAGEVIIHESVLRSLDSLVATVPVEDKFRITAINGILPSPQPVNLPAFPPDTLLRFFPPEAARQDLSGEFRQVVSMFISLPTVQEAEQLAMFIQIVFDLQNRYGGLLNRLDFGDKGASLLLFWGAPFAHENDVMRALDFILGLQSRSVIPVNAGIAYGITLSGYSGGSLAGEYTCHGRGTTLAARFMQASHRGEIWLDENVAARAEQHFEVEFEGEMPFKGFAEPQKVFVLLERKEEAEHFYGSDLIGRQAEQAKLTSFVQPLWQGDYAGMTIIWGEPGIGKSRLAHGFLQHLAHSVGSEFSLFLCQTDDIVQDSLNPFRYWLRRYFEQSEQQSDTRNKRSFSRNLDRLIRLTPEEALQAELDRTRSFLGALVNLHWPDSLYERLDAQGRYENSLTGLRTLLQAESFQQPLILLLEDIHWLDGDSTLFLRQLTQHLHQNKNYPIAILATGRLDGDRANFGSDIAYHEINLDKISPADQEKLAADQLGAPIGAELLDLLVERAEGNPLFTEQILRYLQEQELLLLKNGAWQLQARQETTLPTNVRALLVARLDRLSQNVKEVVQTAAVLGREFEIQLLAYMLDDDPMVEDWVVQAENMSIWSALSELRYLFKHTLLRDAAYRMQIRSRRQSLHKLATEALEQLYEGDLSPHYGELAYHAEQASLIDKARHYLELAADTAKDAFQNHLALNYLTTALKLTPAEDLESRFRLLLAREKLYSLLGARQEQEQDLDALAELAEQMQDAGKQAQALIQKAWFFWWTADYPASLAASRQAARLAETSGQRELSAEANYVVVWVKFRQGLTAEARQFADEALVDARQADDQRLEISILSVLGLISGAEGDHYTARKRLEEALAISRSSGRWPGEGTAMGNLGVSVMILGDYETAKDLFLQAQAVNREQGSKVSIGSGLINLSWNAETQGDWAAAIQYAEEGTAIVHEAKQSEMEAEGLLWLGHAWVGMGQPEKAFAAYQESLNIRRELNQEYLAMGVLAGMSRAALAQADLDSAVSYAAEIISYLDAGGSLDGTWEPLRIYLSCYQVLLLAQDSRAGEILQVAYQELNKRATKIPDLEARRIFLENVPWHREILAAYQQTTSR